MDFKELRKNIKKDYSNHKKVKVALLGDFSTQLFSKALKGYGYICGFHYEIFEADYNQIDSLIQNNGSELYTFRPDFVFLFHSNQKLLKSFYNLSVEAKTQFAVSHTSKVEELCQIINKSLSCTIIYANFMEINDSVFGNYANKVSASFIYQVRKINFELMNLSQQINNLSINDLCTLQNKFGHDFCFDARNNIHMDMPLNIDFLPHIAKSTSDIVNASLGSFKKCLILDLDDTLWGGIIGDDGIDKIQIGDYKIGNAFSELQRWCKQLKLRGIILSVCSKNFEKVAKEPFEKHPDMVLRLEDISIFVANWNNKADNIRYIQEVLNIGFDSMVFLDDNPFERENVKTNFPEICVPDLPKDPSDYLKFLRGLNLFETASFTKQDEQRGDQYRQEATRKKMHMSYSNEDEYLSSLNMISTIQKVDDFSIQRIAQLTQRSNQFNLRTQRYDEEKITEMQKSQSYEIFPFSLKDKFGDYGLISVIILKKEGSSAFIDTWIMSCRVLKRGVENFILNHIVKNAINNRLDTLIGEFLPTSKNELVKDLLPSLGFKEDGDKWILNVAEYESKKSHIS